MLLSFMEILSIGHLQAMPIPFSSGQQLLDEMQSDFSFKPNLSLLGKSGSSINGRYKDMKSASPLVRIRSITFYERIPPKRRRGRLVTGLACLAKGRK